MVFRTNASDRMLIDSTGKVGIGTTSPSYDLDILDTTTASNTNAGISISHATQPQLRFAQTTGNYRMYLGIRTNDLVIADDNGVEKVRFEQNGNVGIGTTSPSQQLHVVGKIKSTDDLIIGGANPRIDYDGGSTGSLRFYSTSASAERMRILSNGSVCIGKTDTDVDPDNGIHMQPDGTVFSNISSSTYGYRLRHDYNNRFFITHLGVINAQSTSISAISDERLKENIKDLETGLNEVLALKPRRFDWVEDEKVPTKNIAGFIAQEVETVLPDLIGSYEHDRIEDAKSLRMGDMIPTLVKAIQEQQELIEALQKEVEELKGG